GDVVVAEHGGRTQRRTDFIRSRRYSLTGGAAVGGTHAIRCYETCERSGKRRIRTTINLVRRIRGHRRIALVDRKVSRVVSDVVVPKHTCRAERGTNLIGTTGYRLTGRAAVCGSNAVPREEANQGAGKARISAAIDLVRGIRRYRSILLLDGKLGNVINDVVVAEHAGRAERSTNLIGTTGDRLTGRAAKGRGYTIRCEEAN